MKRKVMLLTVVLSMMLAGCTQSADTNNTSSEPEATSEAQEETSTEVETPPADAEVISGTVNVPINDEAAEEDTTVPEDENTKYYKSSLSGCEAYITIPNGFSVSYSDEYSIELVKEFTEDVGFDFVDEENETTFYDEIVSTNFADICNTPYVDSINYTKAQLVNFGYKNVFDLTVDGRDFIVGYSPINRGEFDESAEPFWQCYPKTSICVLNITDDNCQCPDEEDCIHTEFIEISCFTHAALNDDEVLSYVTDIIEKGLFDTVKG